MTFLMRAQYVMVVLAIATQSVSCHGAPSAQPKGAAVAAAGDVDILRATEHARLRALVTADTSTMRALHADDFQLINPAGGAVTKTDYLGAVASGQIEYLHWEPTSPIAVRPYGTAAALRYQAELEIVVNGDHRPRRRYWHTDVYERRNGQWQVVWSQATEIR